MSISAARISNKCNPPSSRGSHKCPTCGKGELKPIGQQLVCNRFPVCRQAEVLTNLHVVDETYVYFDTETTGLSAEQNRIIEIGAVKVKNGKVVDEFNTLINPKTYISMRITQITGITNHDLMGKPTEEIVIPQFAEWLSDVDLLVAHNLYFDARFLRATFLRLGLPLFGGRGADTVAMARTALPGLPKHKLEVLSDYFGVPLNNAHRAIHDARAGQQVFEILKQKYPHSFEPKSFLQFAKK
ncbi:MAG: PolC-type DNA polymerase III [Tepidibacillus sp.]